ncbi:tubulin beta-3 chain-like protein [Mycena pura]|uniref:Tubulin beta-3 chain-like protein n=1 Tax=Mycena pura TaxID=153505 RepID=A0AAD6VAZ7_9AGAR|nr:tubulin beta-3 chain-like protein [Mycena pura]
MNLVAGAGAAWAVVCQTEAGLGESDIVRNCPCGRIGTVAFADADVSDGQRGFRCNHRRPKNSQSKRRSKTVPRIKDSLGDHVSHLTSACMSRQCRRRRISHKHGMCAPYDICFRTLKLSTLTYGDLNNLVSVVMSSITTCLRFPGQLNSDLHKLACPSSVCTSSVTGLAPLTAPGSAQYRTVSVPKSTAQMFDTKNMMAASDPPTRPLPYRYGRQGLDEGGRRADAEQEWRVRTMCSRRTMTLPCVASRWRSHCIGHSTAIQELFTRASDQFTAMFKRKALLTEAESNIQDLIAEYQQYQNAIAHHELTASAYGEPSPHCAAHRTLMAIDEGD